MKVLMFGWEFPPHISGGLGTACYGLTKGMSKINDLDIVFVVPKAYGDEDQNNMELLGANNTKVSQIPKNIEEFRRKHIYLEVNAMLIPYNDPEKRYTFFSDDFIDNQNLFDVDEKGKIKFTGLYGDKLIEEIYKYAYVASVISQENEHDVIHAHDWLAYPAGIAAKEVSGKPLVIHVHATDFDRSGGKVNPTVFDIEKRGMDAADQIITVSNLTRQIVIEKYGQNPNKVTTVYNAVEPITKKERKDVKKDSNEKIVTFLGRITLQKGPEYFIEAAKLVLQKNNNVRFVMAGSGDMLEKMIDRVAQLGISDKFHFPGFLKGSEVFEMLHKSDVYVMPSVSEPFGISPLEAMQSDVPTIITNQSGVSEILTHAAKFDYWDVHALADAIYGIVTYDTLPKMFKKNGRVEVDNLKWENSALNVYDVYIKAIENKQFVF
ncbi:glycosyltransferase family 1 protein [Ancylomarina euxinus]|uniref:Glycosyltransferase family 1 protein n=1 Tax=Ancylomarina euxinus TaxID=2283627 RepID=A0A425Y0D9_9BACT|nr:glycosyltransferase family 4 protein [Ancylomarina euxinus]MCZ4695229.1 glycosyltransferase family 4 protein [Ancylomarina euxinus]MUP15426.1 glycosyltransferase [Ancylomarina euxinus]RRG21136.1 glycosyltransferase family 1 protein [Ancylomarina euxinus]